MNVVIRAVKELSTTVGVDCGANTVTKARLNEPTNEPNVPQGAAKLSQGTPKTTGARHIK